jgi:UDP-GlcNAc:undecaprenyl-phosphate GlcNAc-1-phosphate transferase
MLPYLLLFVWAGVSSYLLAFPIRHCALRFDVVDHPEKRKMHQVPIPLMGGLAIFGAFVAVAVPALFLASEQLGIDDVRPFFGLIAGSAIIVALGIYDDIKGANAPLKFTFQTAAALVVILTGARVENFTNPARLGRVGMARPAGRRALDRRRDQCRQPHRRSRRPRRGHR